MPLTDHPLQAKSITLTPKQEEVMDLLVQHMTFKEISRELGISPKTVDNHVSAVRAKFGTADRYSTARAYEAFKEGDKSPRVILPVDRVQSEGQVPPRDLPQSTLFAISDATTFGRWEMRPNGRAGLEALDARFGILGRIGLVCALAALLAITLVLALSIADGLGKVI